MEAKKNRFRKKFLSESNDINGNELLPDNLVIKSLEKKSSAEKGQGFYYEEVLKKHFFPFFEQLIGETVNYITEHNLLSEHERSKSLKRLKKKVKSIMEANEERREILGSDYYSESENEQELRSIFTTEELKIIEGLKLNVNSSFFRNEVIEEFDKAILSQINITKGFYVLSQILKKIKKQYSLNK